MKSEKPIKPRRMWTHHTDQNCGCIPDKEATFTRPVLVVDLSPESVEKLAQDCVKKAMRAKPCDAFMLSARSILAAIGIKPVKKGGRK